MEKSLKAPVPSHLLYLKPEVQSCVSANAPDNLQVIRSERGSDGLSPSAKVYIITHFLHRALSSLRKN